MAEVAQKSVPSDSKIWHEWLILMAVFKMAYEVRFYLVAHLDEELETAHRNGELSAKKFDDVQLFILDEIGYVPFSKEVAEILF